MDSASSPLAALVLWLALVGGWVQHFVTTWAHDMLFLFLVGLLVPPVGILHGWLIWLGIAGS